LCGNTRSDFTNYRISMEGAALYNVWVAIPGPDDAIESGVLADYLQDHRDALLENATGPEPAARLDALIDWLRARLTQPTGA
jgi:hypothetical protein